jgi:hypothetical protein
MFDALRWPPNPTQPRSTSSCRVSADRTGQFALLRSPHFRFGRPRAAALDRALVKRAICGIGALSAAQRLARGSRADGQVRDPCRPRPRSRES